MYLHNALLDITSMAGIENVATKVIIAIIVPMLITLVKRPVTRNRSLYLDS
jgi:hypothetical protein